MCIALYNHEIDSSGQRPSSVDVSYRSGWFSINQGKSHRRKDLTRVANRLLSHGHRAVYDITYRSYALHVNGKKLL